MRELLAVLVWWRLRRGRRTPIRKYDRWRAPEWDFLHSRVLFDWYFGAWAAIRAYRSSALHMLLTFAGVAQSNLLRIAGLSSQHANKTCRRLHFAGTTIAMGPRRRAVVSAGRAPRRPSRDTGSRGSANTKWRRTARRAGSAPSRSCGRCAVTSGCGG